MIKDELMTARLQIQLTPTQKKKIEKLARSDVLTPGAYSRRTLVKTLKLQDS